MITPQQAFNFREVTLDASGIDDSQTTLPLSSGHGIRLGNTEAGTFPLILWDAGVYQTPFAAYTAGEYEVILITSHDAAADTVAVIERGADGSTPRAFNSAGHTYKGSLDFTAGAFDNLEKRLHYLEHTRQTIIPAFTSPFNVSSWISFPVGNARQVVGGASFLQDVLYAQPHFFKKGTIIRGFKARNATGSASNIRVGVRPLTLDGNGNPYPGTLLVQSVYAGAASVTNLITGADLPYTILIDGWYFVEICVNTTRNLGYIDVGQYFDNPLGRQLHSSTVNGFNLGFSVAYTYASLPSSFPESATLVNSNVASGVMPYLEVIYQALS